MKKKSFGFTLIEVAFFIAITGLLFVGIIAGTQSSIWQQKYNDSVQSFADFLRNAYAGVSSTQGMISGGRSDKAIYGKMISFGQEYDLNGKKIPDGEQRIFVYDVIGNATGGGGNDIKTALISLEVNVLKKVDDGKKAEYAGIVESYTPIWGAVIERPEQKNGKYELFGGTILIVRNPDTGLINTLVSKIKIDVNWMLKNSSDDYERVSDLLTKVLGGFEVSRVDFCLNPYGAGQTGVLRRDIRLVENARNASGVEIIDLVNDQRNACANK